MRSSSDTAIDGWDTRPGPLARGPPPPPPPAAAAAAAATTPLMAPPPPPYCWKAPAMPQLCRGEGVGEGLRLTDLLPRPPRPPLRGCSGSSGSACWCTVTRWGPSEGHCSGAPRLRGEVLLLPPPPLPPPAP